VCKVAHNDVGAVLAKNVRVVAAGYADDKTEAARPAACSIASEFLLEVTTAMRLPLVPVELE
jgi:deoxycytidylate deaminase